MSGLVRWPIPGVRLAQGQGAQIITPPTTPVDATVTAVLATATSTAPAATVAGAAGPSREFDGVDDVLTVDNGIIFPLSNGAHSFVMVVKPTSLNSGECFMAARAAGANIAALYDNGSGDLAWLDADETLTASAGLTAGAWQVIGFSKATGTSVARFHRKELGAGSWTHVDSAGSGTGVSTAVGTFTFGAAGAAAFKDCRIAAAAAFTVALTDGDFETITDSTQDIASLSPSALWDFNQASTATDVLDLMNNGASQTALTGTTATTDGPSGWAFGLGGATVTAVPAVALGSAPVASATVTAGATVTAVPAAATGDTPAAVVTGTGSATVTAVPATALGSAPPANSILSSVVNAPAVIALGSAPVAVISSAGNATVTAVPATALGSGPAAVISAGQTVTAVAALALGSGPAAVVSAGATVAAVVALASGQAPRPTITPAPVGGVSGDIAATFAEAFS